MCRKFFLLTLWALLPYGVWGNTTTPIALHIEPSSTPEDICDLAAPTNFQVLALGTTWVQLSWMPSVFGVDHVVKTFRSSDGVLVHQITITPAMAASVVVNGLQSGETYFSTICAVCPDGTESVNFSGTPDYDTLITELIVSGFTETCGTSFCGIQDQGQYCTFPLDGTSTYFKISTQASGGAYRQFLLQKVTVSGESHLRCQIKPENGSPYIFYLDGQLPPPQDPIQGQFFEIKVSGIPVASFKLSENYATNPGLGHITWAMKNTGHRISKLYNTPCPERGSEAAPSNGSADPYGGLAVVSPNPFIDHLDVYLTRIATNSVNLQLFNLAGQKVLDQQLAGGQDQYHLPTGTLANGFYLLRVEADGRVQTLKVVKSE